MQKKDYKVGNKTGYKKKGKGKKKRARKKCRNRIAKVQVHRLSDTRVAACSITHKFVTSSFNYS